MMRNAAGSIMLAAGGTGGHVFPAQALAAELDRRGREVNVVTDRRGGDYSDRFPGQAIHRVSAATPAGRGIGGKIMAALSIARGTLQARRLIRRIGPAAVVGFGGYPALPTMLAAITLSVPRMLHEQNAVLGRVNRLIAARVDAIATSFPQTRALPENDRQPQVLTGNPVRDEIRDLADRIYRAPDSIDPFHLLVFAGSQGSASFSRIIPQALLALEAAQRSRLRVVQQCREEDLESVRQTYKEAGIEAETATFFADLPERLSAAHLVIARSGAGTICELAAAGRPGILIPYPNSTDDHQSRNADALAAAGGAWVMAEAGLTADSLAARLSGLMASPDQLAAAAQAARGQGRLDAAVRLADLVLALANGELEGRDAA